jgi:hypothetical protein
MRVFLSCALFCSLAVSQGSAGGGGGGCATMGTQQSSSLGAASAQPADAPRTAPLTCRVCGGTYAQPGNCPKCGLELTPK